MNTRWIANNVDEILGRVGEHLLFSFVPVLIALLVSIPLGYLIHRTGRGSSVWLALFGLLYAIPSVALFVTMPLLLGTKILDPVNIIAALVIYSVALLVRSVVDGFRRVDEQVRQAAVAMGYGDLRRVLTVELPLAMPVIFSGLRVVTVSNIALVSVGAVIGMGALGQYFDQGFREGFYTPIFVALLLILAIALLADLLILLLQRITLPWFGLGERTKEATA